MENDEKHRSENSIPFPRLAMELSKEDLEEIKDRAAEKLADRTEKQLLEVHGKTLLDLFQYPVSMVGKIASLTEKTVRANFPVINYGDKQSRIQISDMLATIEERKNKKGDSK